MTSTNLIISKVRPVVIKNEFTRAEPYVRRGYTISFVASEVKTLFAFFNQVEFLSRQIDDLGLQQMARTFIMKNFKSFFKKEGRFAIGFARSLVTRYLLERPDACLIFNLRGATVLEMVARKVAPEDVQTRIKGLHLTMDTTVKEGDQILVVKYLHQNGVFHYPVLVFVDTGFSATVVKRITDMLTNPRLIQACREQFGIQIPGPLEIKSRLLCLLNRKETFRGYDIDAVNYQRPELTGVLGLVVAVIDEACVGKGEGYKGLKLGVSGEVELEGEVSETNCFRLMKQALLECLGK